MAKPQLTSDKPSFEFTDAQSEDISALESDIDDQIDSITQEFGGDSRDTDYKISIYKIEEKQGKFGYCFSVVPSELPIIDRVREEFGAGKYESRIFKNKRLFHLMLLETENSIRGYYNRNLP